MMRTLFMPLLLASVVATAQAATTTQSATARGKPVPAAGPIADPSQGMVVTGDQEAPLVLYILPWQPPRLGALPEVDALQLLPKALDSERSVLEDSLNRSEPAALRPSR